MKHTITFQVEARQQFTNELLFEIANISREEADGLWRTNVASGNKVVVTRVDHTTGRRKIVLDNRKDLAANPKFTFQDVTPAPASPKEQILAFETALALARKILREQGRSTTCLSSVTTFPKLSLTLHQIGWTDDAIGMLLTDQTPNPAFTMREIFLENADDPLPLKEINLALRHWHIKMVNVETGCDSGVTVVGPLEMTQAQAQAYWDSVSDQE